MSTDEALALCVALACAVDAILAVRAASLIRRGHPEWQQRWKAVDAERRMDILRHLNAGERPTDKDDAALAKLALDRFDTVRDALRPITIFSACFVLALFVAGLMLREPLWVIIGLAGLALVGTLERSTRHRVVQMHRVADKP